MTAPERSEARVLALQALAVRAAAIAAGTRLGSYQQAVLCGAQALSGADLRGKASQYSGRYAALRAALLQWLEARGFECAVAYARHDRKVLLWGPHARAYRAAVEAAKADRRALRLVAQACLDAIEEVRS